ncbi:MAG: hypothetical protein ACLFP2_05645 [Candidatus Woesearchaeota archaeon]
MDIERKVLKEAKDLETREKHLEHIVGKHLFTSSFAKFFKAGLKKNKQRFLKGVTSALIILMTAQSALAISKDTHNK